MIAFKVLVVGGTIVVFLAMALAGLLKDHEACRPLSKKGRGRG